MLREAFIVLFPEKLRFFPPAPTAPCWPLKDIPDLPAAGAIQQSQAETNLLITLNPVAF